MITDEQFGCRYVIFFFIVTQFVCNRDLICIMLPSMTIFRHNWKCLCRLWRVFFIDVDIVGQSFNKMSNKERQRYKIININERFSWLGPGHWHNMKLNKFDKKLNRFVIMYVKNNRYKFNNDNFITINLIYSSLNIKIYVHVIFYADDGATNKFQFENLFQLRALQNDTNFFVLLNFC